MIKRLLLLFICICFLFGCVTTPIKPPLTAEQVIISPTYYSTDKGRALAIKYQKNLQNIFVNIRAKYSHNEIEFAPVTPTREGGITGGIGFFKWDTVGVKDNRYLGVLIGTFNVFNTLQTDFNKRAATVFSKYAIDLIELLIREKEALDDNDVTGIHISLSWWARNFLESKYYGGEYEGITLRASKEDCKKYLNLEISNQEFVNRSEIIGWQGDILLGKIELDLMQIL